VWDSSFDLNVKSEQDLIDLVQKINDDIEFQNLINKDGEKKELLDVKYLLKRYRTIKRRDSVKEFRLKHDCANCLYYEKPRRCEARDYCFLDEDDMVEPEVSVKVKCHKDKEGNCPYGNEVGTCFGFCLRKILEEHQDKKKKQEELCNDE